MRRALLRLGLLSGVVLGFGVAGCTGTAPGGGGIPIPPDGPAEKYPADAQTHVFALRVGRHVLEPLSDAALDTVFEQASRVLQTVNSECPDVATDVTFLRADSVEVFDTGPAVITTDDQLDAAFDLPQDFKVVRGLVGVCGVEFPDDFATILGCAIAGESVVIVGGAPSDVWAHEWGHVQGLPHRNDCPRNVMHAYESDTNAVNTRERAAFLTPTPGDTRLRAIMPGSSAPTADYLRRPFDAPVAEWLADVVVREYPAGIPWEVAQDCDAEALTYLRQWCVAPEYAGARRNIIRLLGLAGDAESCDLLIERILEPAGELDTVGFNVVAESFLALGRLVRHDSNDTALDFLIGGISPSVWEGRGIKWWLAGDPAGDPHMLLARLSVMALGLSESDVALDHLRALRGNPVTSRAIDGELGDQVDVAMIRLEGGVESSSARPWQP